MPNLNSLSNSRKAEEFESLGDPGSRVNGVSKQKLCDAISSFTAWLQHISPIVVIWINQVLQPSRVIS